MLGNLCQNSFVNAAPGSQLGRYAECRYGECRYGDTRRANFFWWNNEFMDNK